MVVGAGVEFVAAMLVISAVWLGVWGALMGILGAVAGLGLMALGVGKGEEQTSG